MAKGMSFNSSNFKQKKKQTNWNCTLVKAGCFSRWWNRSHQCDSNVQYVKCVFRALSGAEPDKNMLSAFNITIIQCLQPHNAYFRFQILMSMEAAISCWFIDIRYTLCTKL